MRHWALPDVLREKYHFNLDEAKAIGDLLLPMLQLLPVDRANAGGMANHPFLGDTKGMDGIKVDVPLGSKGVGIDGWECEIKKTARS